MVEVIEKRRVHFRIQIYDLAKKEKTGKGESKVINLENEKDYDVSDIKIFIEACFKDKSITDKYLKKS